MVIVWLLTLTTLADANETLTPTDITAARAREDRMAVRRMRNTFAILLHRSEIETNCAESRTTLHKLNGTGASVSIILAFADRNVNKSM
jgi:hypothetical protein